MPLLFFFLTMLSFPIQSSTSSAHSPLLLFCSLSFSLCVSNMLFLHPSFLTSHPSSPSPPSPSLIPPKFLPCFPTHSLTLLDLLEHLLLSPFCMNHNLCLPGNCSGPDLVRNMCPLINIVFANYIKLASHAPFLRIPPFYQ